MTEPYIVAMEHAEFHAQAILRKHVRNRPLAHIENHYRYVAPQPVLSCRTVEVDISGTRTYRAKSAADIIEEQQRLIHHVYKQARNVASAPARKTQLEYKETTNTTPLKSLNIRGNQPLTPRKPRPATGINKKTTILLKPRPNTALGTTTARSGKSRSVPHVFDGDPEWHETSSAYQTTNRQLREQWSTENHSLDEGQFIRGKKDKQINSLDPRSGNQWLLFGAGQAANTSGIVDAFTAMRPQGEVYSIDGTTGSQVARKLQKGDKIRVGVNGNVFSHNVRIKQWTSEQEKKMREAEENSKGRSGNRVPLCWDDQLKQESIKIVSPGTLGDDANHKNHFESHLVVVNDLASSSNSKSHQMSKKSVKINEGYKVKVRSKMQNSTGHDPSQRVTASISIDKRSAEFERAIENLTYEDILQMKVQLNHSKKIEDRSEAKKRRETVKEEKLDMKRKQATVASSVTGSKLNNSTPETTESNNKLNRSNTPTFQNSVQSSLDDLVVGSVPARTTCSRSLRAAGSAQLSEFGPGSRSARPGGSARPESRSLSRVSSAGRPPPVKNQRRNAPNAISNGSKDPEYIQIAQRLPVPRPQSQQINELSSVSIMPGTSLKDAIDSVTSCNRPLFSPDGSILENDGVSVPDDIVPLASSEVGNTSPLVTPPPSPSPAPEYAFDIPTAGPVESDANSVVTPGDLDRERSVISDGT